MKVNDKLYTRDGRLISNSYVTFIEDGKPTHVIDSEGVTHNLTIEQIYELFFMDDVKADVKICKEIIDLTESGGMTFSLLRKILAEKIERISI